MSPSARAAARAEASAKPTATPGFSSCGLVEGTAAGVRDTRPAEGADSLWGGDATGAGTLQRQTGGQAGTVLTGNKLKQGLGKLVILGFSLLDRIRAVPDCLCRSQ